MERRIAKQLASGDRVMKINGKDYSDVTLKDMMTDTLIFKPDTLHFVVIDKDGLVKEVTIKNIHSKKE